MKNRILLGFFITCALLVGTVVIIDFSAPELHAANVFTDIGKYLTGQIKTGAQKVLLFAQKEVYKVWIVAKGVLTAMIDSAVKSGASLLKFRFTDRFLEFPITMYLGGAPSKDGEAGEDVGEELTAGEEEAGEEGGKKSSAGGNTYPLVVEFDLGEESFGKYGRVEANILTPRPVKLFGLYALPVNAVEAVTLIQNNVKVWEKIVPIAAFAFKIVDEVLNLVKNIFGLQPDTVYLYKMFSTFNSTLNPMGVKAAGGMAWITFSSTMRLWQTGGVDSVDKVFQKKTFAFLASFFNSFRLPVPASSIKDWDDLKAHAAKFGDKVSPMESAYNVMRRIPEYTKRIYYTVDRLIPIIKSDLTNCDKRLFTEAALGLAGDRFVGIPAFLNMSLVGNKSKGIAVENLPAAMAVVEYRYPDLIDFLKLALNVMKNSGFSADQVNVVSAALALVSDEWKKFEILGKTITGPVKFAKGDNVENFGKNDDRLSLVVASDEWSKREGLEQSVLKVSNPFLSLKMELGSVESTSGAEQTGGEKTESGETPQGGEEIADES